MNKIEIIHNIVKLSTIVEVIRISQSTDSVKLADFLEKIVSDLSSAVKDDVVEIKETVKTVQPEVVEQITTPKKKRVYRHRVSDEDKKARKKAYMKEYWKTYRPKNQFNNAAATPSPIITKQQQQHIDKERKENEHIKEMIEICSCPKMEKIIKGMGIRYKDKLFYSSKCLDAYIESENSQEVTDTLSDLADLGTNVNLSVS